MRRRVLLPPLDVAAGSSRILWVSSDGATWNGDAGQQIPTFSVRAPAGRPPAGKPRAAIRWTSWPRGSELPREHRVRPRADGRSRRPVRARHLLRGQIKVITNDGAVSTYASGLLNFDPLGQFPGQGEQGLGGILVEPVTGDLFLSLLYDANGPHYPRVERLSSADGGLTMATRTTVLDMPGEFQGQAHYVSHMELIGDGTMFVHMGDGFVTNTARDLNSFRGKILRMNLDGTAPPDNPFYTAGVDTARDYVLFASESATPSAGARASPTASTTSSTTARASTASPRSCAAATTCGPARTRACATSRCTTGTRRWAR